MKRFIFSIFAFFYLFTSFGATVHLHYCMGKMVSWDLTSVNREKCAFCGMQKSSGYSGNLLKPANCCKDDQKEIKAAGDQETQHAETSVKQVDFSLALLYFKQYLVYFDTELNSSRSALLPPLICLRRPIFVMNGSFRI